MSCSGLELIDNRTLLPKKANLSTRYKVVTNCYKMRALTCSKSHFFETYAPTLTPRNRDKQFSGDFEVNI